MAIFDIVIRTPSSPFVVVLSDISGGGGGSPPFTPPIVNQVYPRWDYAAGSSYGVTTGQLWPRGTGHQ